MHAAPPPFLSAASSADPGRSYGILSTYPPTPCGLDPYRRSDPRARGQRRGCWHCARGRRDKLVRRQDRERVGEQRADLGGSGRFQSERLRHGDCPLEYGLYGGHDGEEVLDILCGLTVPSIVVAHTVLLAPTEHQQQVLESVIERPASSS